MDRATRFRDWIVKRLRYMIDVHEKSVAAVEKEMGKGRGYLGDALRGEKRLSLESLLEVLDHLGVDPGDFFLGLTAEEERWGTYPRSDGEGRAGGVADSDGPTAERAPAPSDTRNLLLAVIRVLETKGVLDQDEVLSALAQRKS